MDFIKLPVTDKKVVRDHQGKGSVRVFGFQFGNAFRRGMAQGADAGNAAGKMLPVAAEAPALCEKWL